MSKGDVCTNLDAILNSFLGRSYLFERDFEFAFSFLEDMRKVLVLKLVY